MNAAALLRWCRSFAQEDVLSVEYRKPLIMGILNITPDSFSDAGMFMSLNKACDHARGMLDTGVDILDIGGESSRPGSKPVSLDEELARVIPVIEAIRAFSDICISVDTTKPEVMRQAVAAGASMINDIMALREEGALATIAELGVPVCLMHMQGSPRFMQDAPTYSDGVMTDVHRFFVDRIAACTAAGISRDRLILDPGFGYGKSVDHNLLLLREFTAFRQYGLPVLLGVSRKSTLGAVLQRPVMERMVGGVTVAVYAALQGMSIVRTHDIDETYQALKMLDAIRIGCSVGEN